MEPNTMVTLAKMGAAAALGIAAKGSALGCGTAGMSAITMWKKAYAQGKSAAVACDAFGETGKGMVNYLMVLGVGETVALFVMVFSMMLVS